jgi:hypothetical protein
LIYLLDACALIAFLDDLSAVIVTKDDEIKAAEQADAPAVFWLAK